MNVKTLEEVDQFEFMESTQTTDGTSLKEIEIRLVQTHSVVKEKETKRSVFTQNLNSASYQFCQYFSIDVKAGC